MLPAHRALGKLHAQARAHATAKLSTYATPTGQTPAHKDTRKNFRGFLTSILPNYKQEWYLFFMGFYMFSVSQELIF